MSKAIRFLKIGATYKVVKPFIDYDATKHELGEIWTFDKLTYVAYHDGVCLHVIKDQVNTMYRFMDIPEEQQPILENFLDYVEEII